MALDAGGDPSADTAPAAVLGAGFIGALRACAISNMNDDKSDNAEGVAQLIAERSRGPVAPHSRNSQLGSPGLVLIRWR